MKNPFWDLSQIIVLLQSAALIGVLLVPSWLLHLYYFSKLAPGPISIALAFLVVIIALVFSQLYLSCFLKFRATRRSKRSATARIELTALISDYLRGADRIADIRRASRRRFADFEYCATQALLIVKGDARTRLRTLIREVTLYDRWTHGVFSRDARERKRCIDLLGLLEHKDCQASFAGALEDRSPIVQAAAIRALLRFPDPHLRRVLLRKIEERPFLVRLFTSAEAGEIQEEQPAAVFEQLLRFDQAIRHNDRRATFHALDQLIAQGDHHLASISAEALGSLIAAPLRGDSTA